MSKLVLDSCIALKWVLPEADSAKGLQLRDDYHNALHDLLAPDVFEIEVAHALTRAERQGRIPVGAAAALWTHVMASQPVLQQSGRLAPRAIAISSAMRVGVYDCLYVALAEREQCELVTTDDQLIKKLQPAFPFIVSLATMP